MQKPISYQTAEDLQRAQIALMNWTKQAGDCNYWHKGDIRNRLFNSGYLHHPEDIFHYWLDDHHNVMAFVLLYPYRPGQWFELHVEPRLRYTNFHVKAFQWAEENMLAFAKRINIKLQKLVVETFGCDPDYEKFVIARGYTHDKSSLIYTEHDLRDIPDATLPEGFHFHDATADDAENLADIHNKVFINRWTGETYKKVFTAPLMEHEIVVVAPNGRFVAFTNVWVDDLNKTIVFEPVGTHPDFRRQGIGKVLMVYVLKRMQAEHGTQRAFVCHELPDKNPASSALYTSLGFRPKYQIHEYMKAL